MVVLTSGKGLEHALVIRRNKSKKNQVEPVQVVESVSEEPEKEQTTDENAAAEAAEAAGPTDQ